MSLLGCLIKGYKNINMIGCKFIIKTINMRGAMG